MGYKDFARGETLEAADVNNYLMLQAVNVFETEIERSAQIPSPIQEGMVTYVKSTNKLEFYNGSSWVEIAPYDSLPSIGANDTVDKALLMDQRDPEVVDVTKSPIHYQIVSNFVDGTWIKNIW